MKGSAACHCLALKRAARRVGRLYERHLAPIGLSSPQFSILVAVFEEKGATMASLAQSLDMDRTTLVRALKPLQRDGLVRSAPDPKDVRRLVLELTADGAKKLRQGAPLWQAAQDEIEEMLGARRAASLRSELQSVFG